MRALLLRLLRRREGSVVVEFALIGPVMIAMMLGVLQFGIGMQNYNALRAVSGDVARYAVINYQTSNKLTNAQLQDYARAVAIKRPYGLMNSRLQVNVIDAPTQRVTGATEKTMSVTYDIPTMLSFIGVNDIPLSYSRPIFVIAS